MIDLKFKNVSKRYRVRRELADDEGRHPLVKKIRSLRKPSQDFWALRDASFEVARGEALGIIGHNGAGKSTILKLLASITSPTSGEISINGRLAALIEVGSGFHPELTGRENIYLNGSILGMRRREITEKLDSIVDFAGVRPFLDTPVKRFSSGMYVRLGFSIAAHLDPDILLLDEVLAVGDAAFQAKCLKRIDELKAAGTTIVFISHDLAAVESVCNRVLFLKAGRVVKDGPPEDVIAAYHDETHGSTFSSDSGKRLDPGLIRSLTFSDRDGVSQPIYLTGHPLVAEVAIQNTDEIHDVVVDIVFYAPDGAIRCELTTEMGGGVLSIPPGGGVVEFVCGELSLLPGIYYTDVRILKRGEGEALDVLAKEVVLRVASAGDFVRGMYFQPQKWRMLPSESDRPEIQVSSGANGYRKRK